MSVDLEHLVVEAAPEPSRGPDVDELWRRGRRRRGWERVVVAGGLLVVLVGAAFAVPSLWDGDVEILDPASDEPADVVPAGWQDIEVSGVVFSVPSDWPTIDVDAIPVDQLPATCHIDVPSRHGVYIISRPRGVASCPDNWEPRAQATRVWVFLDPLDDPTGGRWADPTDVNDVTVVRRTDPQFGQLEYHLPEHDVRLVVYHPTDHTLAERIVSTLREAATSTGATPTVEDCDKLEAAAPVDGRVSDDEAQRARAQFGLASDEQTVRQIIEQTGGGPYSLGFPHTDEEFQRIIARNQTGGDRAALRAWVGQEADAFAGMWLDHQAGGVFTVAFTRDLDRFRAELHERFDPAIRVVEAEHTFAELLALQETISRESREIAGTSLSAVGVLEQHNRVSVTLAAVNDQVRRTLGEQYPPEMLCIEQGAAWTVNDEP